MPQRKLGTGAHSPFIVRGLAGFIAAVLAVGCISAAAIERRPAAGEAAPDVPRSPAEATPAAQEAPAPSTPPTSDVEVLEAASRRRAKRPRPSPKNRARVKKPVRPKAPAPKPAPKPAPPPAARALSPAGAGEGAGRMIVWVNCGDVLYLSDGELDQWRSRGVDGFVCAAGHLKGFGGDQDYTADPNAPLVGPNWSMQRTLKATNIIGRARARGMKLYLGIYLTNYWNTRTPLAEWYDDATWANGIVPRLREMAGAARMLGFAGLGFDEELYNQHTGAPNASWSWNYPENRNSEAGVRAKVRSRGAQMMQGLVAGYPGLEIVDYHANLPGGWHDLVQKEINGISNAQEASVQIDFWDGLTSVDGYGPIRFMNAVFYKTPHLNGSTWDSALQYDVNSLFAMLSRRLSNWRYASSRVHLSPFAWINAGPSAFEAANSPEYVASQLASFRKWGTGGEYADYAHNGLRLSEHDPYVSAMRLGSAPGIVDTVDPTVAVGSQSVQGTELVLNGNAHDDMGIRSVRWRTQAGAEGAAAMNWRIVGGTWKTGWQWTMEWSARVPLQAGGNTVTLTAEDIHGRVAATSLGASR